MNRRSLASAIFIFLFTAIGIAQAAITAGIDQTVRTIKYNITNTSYSKTEKINTDTAFKFVYKNGNEIKMVMVMQKEQAIEKRVFWVFDKNQLIYCEKRWYQQNNQGSYTRQLSPIALYNWYFRDSILRASLGDSAAMALHRKEEKEREIKTEISSEKLYLQNGRLVSWIKDHAYVPDSSSIYKQMDAQLSDYGRRLLQNL